MASDAISFYWRPGCPFCMSLERQLDRAEIPMEKLNIWDDPSAAEFVRTHADGNETVPTVAVGTIVMVNPSPAEVLAAMQTETPELIPDGAELPAPGAVGKLVNKLLGS